MIRRLWIAALLLVGGCAAPYTLVAPSHVAVARNSMHVTPPAAWNKAPPSPLNIKYEEDWTENGPALDSLVFIGGLPDGEAITKQHRKDDAQVPVFHATMTPPELTSMIESYYRVRERAKLFQTDGIVPATLFGKPALRFDYSYVGADDVRRRGRSVVAWWRVSSICCRSKGRPAIISRRWRPSSTASSPARRSADRRDTNGSAEIKRTSGIVSW